MILLKSTLVMKALATAFVLLVIPVFSGLAQVIENIPLLTVTGEAVVKVIPDQAIISVRIERKVEITAINTITDAFLFNKENTDINFIDMTDKTVLSTIPEFDVNNKGVTFIKEFIITVHDLSDLPKVVIELLKHNFLNVYSIRYRLSNIEQVMNTARKEAMANARVKALMLSSELGQTIEKAHQVKEEEVAVSNWYIEKNLHNIPEFKGSNYHFNPGYISVPCKVTVSFNLK